MKLRPLSLAAAILLALGASACDAETCATCRDEKCADLVDLCAADQGCACMAECLGEAGIPGVESCLTGCGLTERPGGFAALEECVARACPDDDECRSGGVAPPSSADASADGHTGDDIAGGTSASCGIDHSIPFEPDGTVLQLESADQSICVRLERVDLGAGTLANTAWALESIAVGPVGGVASATAPDPDLCWYSSHHNFLDWAHFFTGTVRYDLKVERDPDTGRSYLLYVYSDGPLDGVCAPTTDGEGPLGGPYELFPVGL